MNTCNASLPREKIIRGYPIRRLALGAYLEAARALSELPEAALGALYPGQTAQMALDSLKSLTPDTALPVLTRALTVLPQTVVACASALTGVTESDLLSDPAIGADGLMEMLEAAWELNGMENFTLAARRLRTRLRAATRSGCKG